MPESKSTLRSKMAALSANYDIIAWGEGERKDNNNKHFFKTLISNKFIVALDTVGNYIHFQKTVINLMWFRILTFLRNEIGSRQYGLHY